MPDQPWWTFTIAKIDGTIVRTAELFIASANETLPHMALALSRFGNVPGPVRPYLHGTDTNYQVHFAYLGKIPAKPLFSTDEHGNLVLPTFIILVHQVDADPDALIARTSERMEDYMRTRAMEQQLSTN